MAPKKRYRYTKHLFFTKVGTGVEYFSDKEVESGRIIVLTSIAVEDETTSLTYVRIGKESGGRFFPWEEQKTPAAAELSFSQEEHWLREAEKFQVKISGGAASDKLHAYLDGYWFESQEEAEAIG